MDESQNNEMMAHFETTFQDIYLNCDTSATNYIQNFKLYVQNLEKQEG